ncbi:MULTISPECIES: DUF937 domain-containing protein [unclassified Agrococcus]|uniref:DUF937 domain-containing protein n=1 Tax=unclassified Agrococcus TaxID=2615065 RepID=UPI00361C77C2
MSEIQQLMDRMPVARIARQAGVDEADAQRALEAVLPALVGGMQANARDDAGAASLERALSRHHGALGARLDGDVDADDGDRIVRNVFGGQTDQVVAALGGAGGGGLGDVVRRILPIVAPMVLAWLAERVLGGGGAGGGGDEGSSRGSGGGAAKAPSGGSASTASRGDNPFARSGGGAGSGSLPTAGAGGARGAAKPKASKPKASEPGGGLGDLLGGILGGAGGGRGSGGGDVLGDLLGGLLGGGRR